MRVHVTRDGLRGAVVHALHAAMSHACAVHARHILVLALHGKELWADVEGLSLLQLEALCNRPPCTRLPCSIMQVEAVSETHSRELTEGECQGRIQIGRVCCHLCHVGSSTPLALSVSASMRRSPGKSVAAMECMLQAGQGRDCRYYIILFP